jgi:hypothetical protein
MLRCIKTISRSSGVRSTVGAADGLNGVDVVVGCVLDFDIVGVSFSPLEESRQSADLMRLQNNIRLERQ